jgi:PQQ-like domain
MEIRIRRGDGAGHRDRKSSLGVPGVRERFVPCRLRGCEPIGVAIRLEDGARRWSVPLDANGARISHAAAATAMPGAVFVAGSDGKLHGLSSTDGREVWVFETARDFPTSNNVAARGGSIRAPGVTVAGGNALRRVGLRRVSQRSAGKRAAGVLAPLMDLSVSGSPPRASIPAPSCDNPRAARPSPGPASRCRSFDRRP